MLFDAGTPICVKCDDGRGRAPKRDGSSVSGDVLKPKAVDRNRVELEQDWRNRTEIARQRYQRCSDEHNRIAADVRKGLFEAPDGSEAVRQAHQRENAALEEYMRTLKRYSDLALRGTVPDEPKS